VNDFLNVFYGTQHPSMLTDQPIQCIHKFPRHFSYIPTDTT